MLLIPNAPWSNDVGVDLGTGNTLVHVRGRGVVVNEPSVVAVQRSDRSVRAIGLEAKRMLGRTTADVQAIRPLRDGVIADVDIAEAMLRRFLKQAMPRRIRATRPRVVVGVPSGITELERRAVRSSAAAAGAREVYMIAEPIAAAIGVGMAVDTPTGNMVIDIGGGTTEIAVMSLGGIVADASIRVAGDEMDQAIMVYARKQHNLLIGEATAETIKMHLGCAIPDPEIRDMEVRGRDLVSGIPRGATFNSHEVCECIQEPIQTIIDAVGRALEITPPELAADIIDRGIVMCGGGALIRGLDTAIERRMGVPVRVAEEPLMAVVRGTAAILDNFERYRWILRD
ncbi:MAG TPA: rod shape-determining protein [Longimicrobiales bacterium]|nr:rod shape-determining protein [Longimicrobiales bacterium]